MGMDGGSSSTSQTDALRFESPSSSATTNSSTSTSLFSNYAGVTSFDPAPSTLPAYVPGNFGMPLPPPGDAAAAASSSSSTNLGAQMNNYSDHSHSPTNHLAARYPASSPVHASTNGGSMSMKRPSADIASSSSPYSQPGGSSRKKAKRDDEDVNSPMDADPDEDDESPDPPGSASGGAAGTASASNNGNGAPQKVKATRGSRACTVCRRLKMKCVGAENGPPCKRCIAGKHQCIFEESNRGKRTSKKHEVLTKSIKKMEAQLETVMRSLKNPTLASLVAANGGIPGIIPAQGGGDEEMGSPSESLVSLPDDVHGQQQILHGQHNSHHSHSSHQQQHQQQQRPSMLYGASGSGRNNSTTHNSYSNASRQSFDSPGRDVDRDSVVPYASAAQQQLTRNTENLTSHSPQMMQSPPSPRSGSGGLHAGMSTPMSHARGLHPSQQSQSGSGSGHYQDQGHHSHSLPLHLNPSSSSYNSHHSHPHSSYSSQPPHTLHSHTPIPPSNSTHPHSVAVQQAVAAMPLSPHLNTLPDNALNPLGLLAEASLANRRASSRKSAQEIAEQLVDQAIHGELDEDGEPVGGSSANVANGAGTPSVNGTGTGTGAAGEGSSTGAGEGDESASRNGTGSTGSAKGGAERKVGVANETYFRPGPMNILPLRRLFIERQVQPEMLSFVSTEEVLDLFKIYFTHMSMHCSVLIPDFHTPSLVCSRSPFLLTVICAIASKFYPDRPDLHPRLNRIVKKLSFNVPERGFKSLEIVQAYLLLALWGCGPVERFEQDKTWLLLGLAIRMATDLNLHRKGAGLPPDGPRAEWRARERELRNRERTWMLCYILDRSCSAQMGKPHSIIEDYIIRSTNTWYRLPETRASDPGIAAYAEMQRILSRSLDFLYSNTTSQSGLHTDTDYLLVVKTIESQLFGWQENWDVAAIARAGFADFQPLPVENYNYFRLMTRFYFNYSMLVVNSFGLQNALERSRLDVGHFFGRCYSSAMACALIVRDELGPQGFLRYSPDSHFVLSSYAVLTLLKLIRPEFHAFIESEQRTLSLVNDVANTLESVAVNSSHTPALYSTFLRAVVAARTAGPSLPSSPRVNPAANPASSQQPNNNSNSPLDMALASNPAAGVFGDEQQFGDGALGLKMFPPSGSGDHSLGAAAPGGATPGDMHWHQNGTGAGGELDLQAAMSFQLPNQPQGDDFSSMSMDNILSGGFWDNVLIPGYSSGGLEGLSGGFVYGSSGSGFITPRRSSPEPESSGMLMPPPSINGLTSNGIPHTNGASHLSIEGSKSA